MRAVRAARISPRTVRQRRRLDATRTGRSDQRSFRRGAVRRTRRQVRPKRRRRYRLPGRRRRPHRHRLRARDHRRPPVDLGAAAARPSRRGSRRLRAGAHARQARDRPVRPRPRGAVARDDDGRRPGGDGRRRVRERAVLWTGGTSTGIGVLFAATYPERCAGLVLFDPRIRGTRSSDYPWAPTEEDWRRAARRRPRRLGRAGLPRGARSRVGARGRRRRGLPSTGSSGTCAGA